MASGGFKVSSILLPYQRDIFYDDSKFICLLCSRQVGKSLTLSGKAYMKALLEPGSLIACVSTGERAANEFLTKVRQWGDSVKIVDSRYSYTASADSVKLSNGSRIISLPSGNTSALRGWTGSIILDEFAMVQKDFELWKAVVPIITNRISHPDKSIWVASTPTGLNTQFAKIWFNEDKIWSKHKVTIYDAKKQGLNVDVEELKKVVNDDLIFRTEYLCEFASDSSSYIDLSSLDFHVSSEFKPSEKYAIGVDVGRKKDLTAISIIRIGGKLFVDSVLTLKNTPYNEQMNVIRSLNEKYKFCCGYVDEAGIGNVISEEVTRTVNSMIKGFSFTSSNKTQVYDRLKVKIQNHQISFPEAHSREIKDDFENVRRYVSQNGVISYSAGHNADGHSDIVSSIVLGVESIKNLYVDNPLKPFSYSRRSVFG